MSIEMPLENASLTQLQQTQTAYQAALTSGSLIMNLSLLNYLH